MDASIPFWQPLSLSFLFGFLFFSSLFDLTRKFRSLVQPWVTKRVLSDTPLILKLQSKHHPVLDGFFSIISCIVSVPFYTGFLPLLFWSGHSKLARQMTILIAFCDYIGNAIKDLVSAPRPNSPPIRRITATHDEKENAMEYGLPSSHALNTVCLSGYLLYYVLRCGIKIDTATVAVGYGLVIALVVLIALGRVYLGMHSLIDVAAGIILGLGILAFWIMVHEHVDDFIVNGQNVTYYWAGISLLVCFAYPTPEVPTPSFDYHAAFTGVAFGIVSGVQQTYIHFHHESMPQIFTSELPFLLFIGRVMVGIPTILIVKFCSKAISKWLLPVICNTLCIPITSSCYIPALKDADNISKKKTDQSMKSGYFNKYSSILLYKEYDVDTGIRFVQYAGLAWSVVDLVPSLFSYLNL